MKNLITYTRPELENMKLAQITDINNSFAIELGLKPIKRFASKDKAILRTIKNRDLYVEEFAEHTKAQMHNLISNELNSVAKPKKKDKPNSTKSKSKSSRFNMDAVVSINIDHGKLGSIEKSIQSAISSGSNKVSEIVDFVLNNHTRPRSTLGVSEQYVIHNIKWFVKVGSLKLEE